MAHVECRWGIAVQRTLTDPRETLMNTISKAQLQQLVNATDDDFISLYMPTYPVGEQGRQNPIRFGKLLRAAEEVAIERGMDIADARGLLAPACELLDRPIFWQARDRGLAVLVARDGLRVWHMPLGQNTRTAVKVFGNLALNGFGRLNIGRHR